MDKHDDIQRTDALINAQKLTAVATLAAAIVQVRNAVGAPEIIEAVSDAEHILTPNRGTSPYVEWRKENGLSPA